MNKIIFIIFLCLILFIIFIIYDFYKKYKFINKIKNYNKFKKSFFINKIKNYKIINIIKDHFRNSIYRIIYKNKIAILKIFNNDSYFIGKKYSIKNVKKRYENEKNNLLKLSKYDISPQILEYNDKDRFIIMTDVGKRINTYTPNDKSQIKYILDKLIENKIYNEDTRNSNFLKLNNKIRIIDLEYTNNIGPNHIFRNKKKFPSIYF